MFNVEILLAFIAVSVGCIGLLMLNTIGEVTQTLDALLRNSERIAQAAEDGVYEDWDDSGRDMIATLDAWSGGHDAMTKGRRDEAGYSNEDYMPTAGV